MDMEMHIIYMGLSLKSTLLQLTAIVLGLEYWGADSSALVLVVNDTMTEGSTHTHWCSIQKGNYLQKAHCAIFYL